MSDYTNAETLVLHGGQYRSDTNTNAVVVLYIKQLAINSTILNMQLICLLLKNWAISTRA